MRGKRLFVPITLMFIMVSLGFVIPGIYNQSQANDPILVVQQTRMAEPTLGVMEIISDPQSGVSVPTPLVSPTLNCTYNAFYWRSRPEEWPAQIVFGGKPYSKNEIMVLFEIETDDLPSWIIREAYVVFLNILNGADTQAIERPIVEASDWTSKNPPGSLLSQLNREIGLSYLRAMQEYNEGIIGPGLCANSPVTPTAFPGMDVPAQNTAAPPGSTPLPASSITPTPTATRGVVYVPPAPTKEPPRREPTDPPPPPQPTAAPLPPPTATPMPPTSPPPTAVPPTTEPTVPPLTPTLPPE